MALRPIDGDVGGAGSTGGEAVAEPMLSEYVSIWGDSRTAQNYSTATNEPTPVARSWAWWFETLSQRVRMSKNFNFGVSGDSIAQLWARIEGDVANAYGVKPSQVPAGVAVVLIGTNSVNAGTSMISMMTDLHKILDWLTGRGHKVLLVCEWPRGTGTTEGSNGLLSAANQKLMYQYAQNLRMIKQKNVFPVDVWPHTADPLKTTASPLAGFVNTDGLHNSPGSAFVTGKLLAQVTEDQALLPRLRIPPSSNGDVYDAVANPTGTLNSNPMLQKGAGGTLGSNASGEVPEGYTLTAPAGMTAVGSFVTVTMPNGLKRQAYRVVLSGTPTVNNATATLRQSGMLSKVNQAQDVLEGGAEVIVSDGHVNFAAPAVCIDTGVNNTRAYGGLSITGDTQLPAQATQGYYGVSRTCDLPLAEQPTQASAISFECRPMFTLSGVASNVTIDFLSMWCRKKRNAL